jgi:hypothetical protein
LKRKKCTKTRYASREDAQHAIDGMARRFGWFTFKRAYRCGPCRAYHISSTPPPRGRRKQW